MNHRFVGVVIAAFFASVAQSATIVISTSTSCSTDEGIVTDPSSCNLAGAPNGSTLAQAYASYSISGNTLTINLSDSATVQGTVIPGPLSGAVNSASAQSSISLEIFTVGSDRPGFVVPVGSGYALGNQTNGGGGEGTALLDSVVGFQCASPNNVDCISYGNGDDYPRPITLGTDFDVYATASAVANVATLDVGVLGGEADAGVGFSFQFFEADGVTPVDIALVSPEPGAGATAGLALLIAGALVFGRKGRLGRECRSPPKKGPVIWTLIGKDSATVKATSV